MSVQLELWQLITLCLSVVSGLWAIGKLWLTQMTRQLDERFRAQDAASRAHYEALARRLDALEASARAESGEWRRVDRDLMNLRADLPLHYVRREDYVQAIATVMAKIDGLGLRVENVLLRIGAAGGNARE